MKKYLSTLFLILALLCFSLSVSANSDWTVSVDNSTVSNGERIYEKYSGFRYADYLDAESCTVYNWVFDYEDSYENELYTSDSTDEFVWSAYSEYYVRDIYATSEGKEILDSFISGNYSRLRFVDAYDVEHGVDTNESLKEKLDSLSGETLTVDVTEIADADTYYTIGYDETETFAHIISAVYVIDKTYYYVNYDMLPNSYFDSDGFFSYRKGKVELFKLDDELTDEIRGLIRSFRYRSTEFKTGDSQSGDTYAASTDLSSVSAGFVSAVTVIIGYILPIAVLVLGLVLPRTKKFGYTKRWYALSILSGIWIALVTTLLLIVML
ncbi:MAG: hypothetical protein IJ391_01520 [Clostridia bacterium]|nr:hypothetical protein [Clostridia bacterium]